ncbi:hypothetical protein HJC23_008819 [Cyclotella cryptica]|uniref:HhH-GPD domain-containing protein n=1 Tax=Cyclotella cryptica TaxID=29204 RepID=A0ABD3QBI8_9STRA|eukprot:CCRYP_007466-RA/>CCRYP_007466-RA protein AED:0.18 eAED:-0.09 QI:0/-1/0/1/-1/1/1/0/392
MKPDEVKSSRVPAVTFSSQRISTRKRQHDTHVKIKAVQSSMLTTNQDSKRQKSKRKTSNAVKVESHDNLSSINEPLDKTGPRPTAEECYYVTNALSRLHPHIVHENNKRRKALLMNKKQLDQQPKNKKHKQSSDTPVTDAIIGTMLSQNTTDANCHKAFATLQQDFPGGWQDVANAPDITLIENSIKVAGLAKTRAQRIQGMLRSIQDERGEANFEYLQHYESNDDIVKELSRFKGMGPKTISCVLLFALGRNDFPVDTHVLRITQQMGWVDKSSSRESAYAHFKTRIPEDCMMDLHCLLVEHGKVCFKCAANGRPQFPPKVGKKEWVCPLVGIKNGKFDEDGFGKSLYFSDGLVKIKSDNHDYVAVKEEESSLKLEGGVIGPQIKVETTYV